MSGSHASEREASRHRNFVSFPAPAPGRSSVRIGMVVTEIASVQDILHHLFRKTAGFSDLERKESRVGFQIADGEVGKDLHGIQQTELFGLDEKRSPFDFALQGGKHQQPIADLSQTDAAIDEVMEEVHKDVQQIEIGRKHLDGSIGDGDGLELLGSDDFSQLLCQQSVVFG